MSFPTPSEVRRGFAKGEAPVAPRIPRSTLRRRRKSFDAWPGGQRNLKYDNLERQKEIIVRILHPTLRCIKRKTEYRLSIMPWSRGSYIDLRLYRNGHPTAQGVLLHLDIISVLLPDLIATVRRLEMEDQREPEQKAKIVLLPGGSNGKEK